MACQHCNGTGWRNVVLTSGGQAYSGVKRCGCRAGERTAQADAQGGFADVGTVAEQMQKQIPRGARNDQDRPGAVGEGRQQPSDEQIERAGGTVSFAAARAAMLGLPDREIAAIILNHRGKKNAVSIEDICKMLWPQRWFDEGLRIQGSAAEFQAQRNGLIRTVKASVERIRTEAHIPVAASKGHPGGYYVPETAEECDECHDRLFGEGIKLIRLSQLFKKDTNLVEELRGQMKLEEVGNRK